MITVVGVRFKDAGKIYYFDPGELEIKVGHDVIVETARGLEYGHVVIGPRDVTEEDIVAPLKPVVNIATEEEFEKNLENKRKAVEALKICEKKVKEHALDMKLIDVEYTFDNNKVIFYFTSDGRVDFRDLVKDLASIFRTRIELRQIGVRDEAKMVNGLGPCGREICCANWLGDFAPVSIKMAKDQGLSLNPVKISGLCGRLMCCLKYEHECYKDLKKGLPVKGDRVKTPMGEGIVMGNVILKEQVNVRLSIGRSNNVEEFDDEITIFKKQEVKIIKRNKNKNQVSDLTYLDVTKEDLATLKKLDKEK